MNTATIITTLLAAAAWLKEPAHAVASQALRDLYDATKYCLKRKFAPLPDAGKALELAVEKPTSVARQSLLIEEASRADLPADEELQSPVRRLSALLPLTSFATQGVHVEGSGNEVKVAGRDLIVTERHVRRVAITPDERHLMHEQRRRLLEAIHELAERLASPNGWPNLAAVHAMLQRRFGVPSYLLIARERWVAGSNTRRAAHRSC